MKKWLCRADFECLWKNLVFCVWKKNKKQYYCNFVRSLNFQYQGVSFKKPPPPPLTFFWLRGLSKSVLSKRDMYSVSEKGFCVLCSNLDYVDLSFSKGGDPRSSSGGWGEGVKCISSENVQNKYWEILHTLLWFQAPCDN